MKLLNKLPYLIFSLLLLVSSKNFGQNEKSADSSNIKLMTAAREIMAAAGNCALITLDQEGRSRVRVMDPFLPETDFTVWFGTNPKSRKVDQIKNDPRVTLYYFDSKTSGYVMIQGKAQIIDDQKEKEKHWKVGWENFYQDKDAGFVLIKVSPVWMEVISYTHEIFGNPATWEPPIVLFETKD